MILPWTFNYMSGGPEYAKMYSELHEERWRRHKDAAVLNPDRYCKNVARRAGMQFSGHWTALPIARNLAVRYQALRRAYAMVRKRRKSGMPLEDTAKRYSAQNTHMRIAAFCLEAWPSSNWKYSSR